MKTTKITDDVLEVLSGCTVSPSQSGSMVVIEAGQLDRKLYQAVNKVLETLGGSWSRKEKGHFFTTSVEDARERMDEVILSGEFTQLSKNGYFPTPAALADEVVYLADLQDGQRILEPSAGSGNLIDAMVRDFEKRYGRIHISTTIRALEVARPLAQALADKYRSQPTVIVTETDFLSWELESPTYTYDRIGMNPPFEKRADAKHVLHAFSLLKPGGRLVAIMSAGVKFRREAEYARVRDLVAANGTMTSIPEGSFKESGTNVNTVMVVIDKDSE